MSNGLASELAPYLVAQPPSDRLSEFVSAVPRTSPRTIDFLVDLNRHIHDHVKYVIRLEPGVQSCDQTLELGSGSCRDSAWLLVQVARHLGLAARFVSGYLIQLKADEKPLDGPAGTDRDFTDLHAWTEVYLPGAGWVGLDPTSGLLAAEGHLPLAATPDPISAAPISGDVEQCEVEFKFEMSVDRIHEDPRVTKPYTDEQWTQIETLGQQVDQVLQDGNVRLTMGGEPTFVSIDDMDGDEWNITALGPNKRRLGGNLFRRLADRFAGGPLLHYGQGKWYPGESLPRWALGCYWRNDGAPIWQNRDLIANDDDSRGYDDAAAGRLIVALANRLGVSPEFSLPAYEDIWYYLWKERRLPINTDPFESKLTDPEERARLASVFEQGFQKIVGYVLPLRVRASAPGETEWESGPWFFRPERMYLIPGDSPMGYRLPLDSLPWLGPAGEPQIYHRDPAEPREMLPHFFRNRSKEFFSNGPGSTASHEPLILHQAYESQRGGDGDIGPGYNGTSTTTAPQAAVMTAVMPSLDLASRCTVRTALCVQARQGILHVFVPPVGHLEDYLHLIATIEETAQSLGTPVRIEGYPPPYDHRLTHFKVTPDPGVIEVNVQPSRNWNELVSNTTAVYEEAREARLGTEKFMLDGRHTGTGGGNHLVLGGRLPKKSFLTSPRSAPKSDYLLEQSTFFVVSVFRTVHWTNQSGSAYRRSAP